MVAVLGAGHIPGVTRIFGTDIDTEELDSIPEAGPARKILSWGIPLAIIGLIIYGFMTAGSESGSEMIKLWFVVNMLCTAIGCAIALAHPLTVIIAALSSPLTSLNPFIGAGWVAALIEAIVRKPRVSDFETVADDISSIAGFWKNRVAKVLLVMVLASLGSMVGTVVAVPALASLLG